MKERLITSAIGIVLFLAVLLAPSIVFDIFVVLITLIAILELYNATGIRKIRSLTMSGIIGAALCPLFGFANVKNSIVLYEVGIFILVLYIVVLFAIIVFHHKRATSKSASVAFFGATVVSVLYSYLIALRESGNGVFLIITLFLAVWMADGGAYFAGRLFGKHLLAPVLSPKKTIEGAVGGLVSSVIAMAVYYVVLTNVFNVEANLIGLLVTGVACGILGPIGDIATSAIKREYGIKDYGKIIPGHGGVLDRFDSILLATPFVFMMSEAFHILG